MQAAARGRRWGCYALAGNVNPVDNVNKLIIAASASHCVNLFAHFLGVIASKPLF